MTVKICFNNQTHRISKNPVDFASLLQKVGEIFGNQLPQSWTLQYLDSDEDKIMLNSQEDYTTLLEEEIGNSTKSVKIFVLPLEESQSKVDLSSMIKSERKDSVEIIERPVEVLDEVLSERVEAIIKAHKEMVVEPLIEEKIAEPIVEEKILITEAILKEEKPKVEILIKEEVEPEQKPEETKPQVEIHPLHKIFVNFLRPRGEAGCHRGMTAEKLQKIQEKKQRFLQRAAEKQAKKKNELRDAVTDIIYEQLPIIASLTKEYIQDNRTEQQAPKVENTSVHRIVRCDGCGVFPIVGIRYKCYTCPDFDYCEKCEATKEHPHPFIKFKKPDGERAHCMRNRGPFFGRVHPGFHHQARAQPEMRGFPHGPLGFVRCLNKMNEELRAQQQAQAQSQAKPEAEPVIIKAEVVIEEVKPEEIKKEEEKKEYDAQTREKAEKLREVFGDLDMEHVLEFVSQVSDLSLEDLIGSYQGF